MDISDTSEDLRSHRDEKGLASAKESLLQQPPISPDDQFERRGLSWWSVSWRLVAGLVCSAILLVCLSYYSSRDDIPTWDRRIFNTVTLLLSGLVSLCFGSLLHVLGGTIRWPLLARHEYTPHEVDLILGMHNPTGTIRLIGHQFRKHKWSATTFVALLYLVFTTISTLSVAAFGLVYNLNESIEINYPLEVTDFGHDEFALRNYSTGEPNAFHVAKDKLEGFHTLGYNAASTLFNVSDQSTYNMKNISGYGLDRSVDKNTVIYTYHLHEWRGLQERQSPDKIVHTSSTCTGRFWLSNDIYDRDGKLIGKRPYNVTENGACYPVKNNWTEYEDYESVIYNIQCGRNVDSHAKEQLGLGTIWAMKNPYDFRSSDSCATSYMFGPSRENFYALIFECKTCITHGPGKTGLSTAVLTKHPGHDLINVSHALLSYQVLKHQFYISYWSATGKNPPIFFMKDYLDDEYAMSIGSILNETLKAIPELEVKMANLAARRPILTIIGAQVKLPHIKADPAAKEEPIIITKLEAKWERAIGILAGVLGLNVALVLVTWLVSRNVPVIDHQSTLAVARLVRTALSVVETGPIAPTGRLADRVKNVSGTIRYGTRRGTGEYSNLYQLDLWNDVRDEFPKKAKYV